MKLRKVQKQLHERERVDKDLVQEKVLKGDLNPCDGYK